MQHVCNVKKRKLKVFLHRWTTNWMKLNLHYCWSKCIWFQSSFEQLNDLKSKSMNEEFPIQISNGPRYSHEITLEFIASDKAWHFQRKEKKLFIIDLVFSKKVYRLLSPFFFFSLFVRKSFNFNISNVIIWQCLQSY